MSNMRAETNPSFLSPIRAMMQPTLLDLEQYFPGRRFWKFALLEPYVVGSSELKELQEKGWQEIEEYEQNPIVLTLTSQLSLVLALTTERGGKKKVMLWARSIDLQHAKRFPVVLTSSFFSDGPDTERGMMVGTHAIIFEGSQVLCYELNQLGEEGMECWQRLVAGLRSLPLTGSPLEEAIHTNNMLFLQAQEAALRLSEMYWYLHEKKKEQAGNLTARPLPSSPNVLRNGGIIIPQLDPVEGVLLALSHAQKEKGGWKEINAIPTYVHQRSTSTTEVTVRPLDGQIVPSEITKQLWQRVRQFNDVDGDILLAMLAQYLGTPRDTSGGTWITAQQILEYRGIQPKTHRRNHPKKGEQIYRRAGHRFEDMEEIAEGVKRIRDTHISVRTWKESHRKTTSKSTRKRVYTQESYLVTISDYIQQSQLDLEEHTIEEGLAIAWYYRPGSSLHTFLTGPNYRAAWLLQQVLRYDPYHEQWEKRLARYFTFQMRMNAEFGGTTIRRSISALIDELALPLNSNSTHPSKIKARFERAMDRLKQDGIISDWGPQDPYKQAMKQLPRYDWLENWLACEIEITADPLPHEQIQSVRKHLQVQRRQRRTLLQEGGTSSL